MILKRIDEKPTDEILIEKMKQNSVGRNGDLISFLSLIDSVEGGYSFFIDGKWGDGKTFFVKQVILLLKHLNKYIGEKADGLDTLFDDETCGPFNEVHLNDFYLPVYYNAWENDTFRDPLITLIGTMATSYEDIPWQDSIYDKRKEIAAIIDAILKPLRIDVAEVLREGLTAKHLLDEMKEEKQLREKLACLIHNMLAEKANKLVLIIDELDRCSPAFALKLLERIKFLFDSDKIIIVFSTNLSQLANTVKGFYGEGMDGEKYLSKFYDQKLSLRPVSVKDYLSSLGVPDSSYHYDQIVHGMAKKMGYSMRDCNRYYQSLPNAKDMGTSSPGASTFFSVALVPVLIAINIHDSAKYQEVVGGTGFRALEEFTQGCEEFESFLVKCNRGNAEQGISAEKYLEDVYYAAFGNGRVSGFDQQNVKTLAVQFQHIVRRY